MKLTESRIKQIIKEELSSFINEEEQEEQNLAQGQQKDVQQSEKNTDQKNQQEKPKLQTDVANIEKFLPKIDNVKEYNELIKIIMQHNFGNDNQKKVVLKQLKDLILNMLSK